MQYVGCIIIIKQWTFGSLSCSEKEKKLDSRFQMYMTGNDEDEGRTKKLEL